MVRRALFGVLGCIALCRLLPACGDEETSCSLEFPPPIVSVQVTDAMTRQPICDAVVRWTAGDFDQRISPHVYAGGCTYSTYDGVANAEHTLTVTALGYRPFTTRRWVGGNKCGLYGQHDVDAELTR